ncbi:MAG: cytochrome c family protein [Hydrogenophilales bacterium CG17_big_fil_post_rev_8_21_14_2_50_63_12]|nr:MAG: cytochrome c family protein [Hydrogenophilales bacterium CG17_big_fil_post_rev_8_21_14_2_50_63_12]PIX96668.1 MAG: cytochrome c family protein [Hydrogenophilales bacterium CG_4_10_14_3_um_filter_63_21]PJB03538.1 MAG: cytochrome c family protein [Hydrogenophilales bacterium CG_4_9_14_3_um_filter_63_34]
MKPSLKLALLTSLLAGCAANPQVEKQAALTEAARQAGGGLIKTLGGELKAAMTAGGPATAIGVCKEKAPKIAAEAAQKTGFMIKRVSPKNRNPKGVPDAWESEALASLEQRLAAGEKPETLDMSAVVDTPEGKLFRYAKALPTQAVCLNCHGDPDRLSPEVKARLATEYPNDKAVGYSAGMIRGVLSMKKAM